MAGQFVKRLSAHPAPGGSSGPAVRTAGNTTAFAAADDNTGSLLLGTLDEVDQQECMHRFSHLMCFRLSR